MKQILWILPVIFLTLCSSPDTRLYRWEPLLPEADSLTLEMERKLNRSANPKEMRVGVEKLESIAYLHPNNRDLSGRAFFWRAKMYDRMNQNDSATHYAAMARLLIDSASRPYDIARLNLICTYQPESLLKEYFRVTSSLSYALKTNDRLMEADALVKKSILSELLLYGDSVKLHAKEELETFKKVQNIYHELGLTGYELRINVNLSLTYMVSGDTVRADSILTYLIHNKEARRDTSFYTKVLFDYGLLQESPEYMARAAALIAGKDAEMETTCRWQEGIFEMLRGDTLRADSIYRSLLSLADKSFSRIKVSILAVNADRLEREGKTDSALAIYKRVLMLEDSLGREAKEVATRRIELQSSFERYRQETAHAHTIERLKWLLAISALLIAALGVYIMINRRLRHERARKMQAETKLRVKETELATGQRDLMGKVLEMTEKDNVLQSISEDVARLEKEGKLSKNDARQLDVNIRLHLSGRQEWEDFREVFTKVHPAFVDVLREKYPSLTEGDLKLAVYIRAGLETKQIARMLMLQPGSVKMNRHRLRERMRLGPDERLEEVLSRLVREN